MRQPGIVGLHTLTTLNALHYASRTTGDANLRAMMLLQARIVPADVPRRNEIAAKLAKRRSIELSPRDENGEFTVQDVTANSRVTSRRLRVQQLSLTEARSA